VRKFPGGGRRKRLGHELWLWLGLGRLDQYRRHWENKLDALETYLEKLKKGNYGKQKK